MDALKSFESNQSHMSFRKFNSIIEMAYFYDWNTQDRKSIAYSFLRIAEQNWDEKEFYISEARKFINPNELNISHFQDEIVELFHKENKNLMSFPIYHFFESPRYVFLNSKKVNLSEKTQLLLPSGKIRLTIISNYNIPFHFIGTRDTLLSMEIVNPELPLGSCGAPRLPHHSLRNESFIIKYSKLCEMKYTGGVFMKSYIARLPDSNHLNKSSLDEYQKLKERSPMGTNRATKPKWKRALYWTLGIVAAGVIYENSKSKPTTKKVFQ